MPIATRLQLVARTRLLIGVAILTGITLASSARAQDADAPAADPDENTEGIAEVIVEETAGDIVEASTTTSTIKSAEKNIDKDTEDVATEEKTEWRTLDLGGFKINDLRPTRNETAKLTFKLHLALSVSLNKEQFDVLQRWKHRLRDQVITAIRISQVKDFQEADLARLRRIILIRVNRLLETNLAEEVLVTEYLFRTF